MKLIEWKDSVDIQADHPQGIIVSGNQTPLIYALRQHPLSDRVVYYQAEKMAYLFLTEHQQALYDELWHVVDGLRGPGLLREVIRLA